MSTATAKAYQPRFAGRFVPFEMRKSPQNKAFYGHRSTYSGKAHCIKDRVLLDPFTGTGTFIVRLLQSGLINKEDLLRKYTKELHANEIILLSYYIAAINIEETFHSVMGGSYQPFEGIVLTDTFESTEKENSFIDGLFNENNERLKRQQQEPIFAIIGNPPYSIGQDNVNNDNQNQRYPILERNIEETYVRYSNANLRRSLYDSYIKAFKWSSERIKDKGVIGFVTNASFIDSQSTDGLRYCWHKEFNYIYVFNLRGNQRTEGEKSRQEGGKIFDSGSRAPIAITLLIKDGSDNHKIYYHDIGDYLSRNDKLKIISDYKSVINIDWQEIIPDKHNDWINQREASYETFIPFINEEELSKGVFKEQYTGVVPARDTWVVGFSKQNVQNNVKRLITNYQSEIERLGDIINPSERLSMVNKAESFIKWSTKLNNYFARNNLLSESGKYIEFQHRPFTKKWLYWDNILNERPSSYRGLEDKIDKVLYIQGQGSSKVFSALITNLIPNFQLIANGKGFPMYIGEDSNGPINNINNLIKKSLKLDDETLFYYIYAILHSNEYRQKFSSDLQKAFPRIPILKNKEKYIDVGRNLADLHLNYESVSPYEGVEIIYKTSNPSYKVTKMKHPRRGVLDTIVFNHDITITNIPEKAYEYIVNGKSAIEWIIDQYQVKTDKKSGITDDPNLYSEDEKYIFNLLLSIINVSVQTVELVKSLPPLEIEE
ncbi:type ISP restriction/modification enzyme [Turicibacter sanguinis]|uniref:type ISP restriction/modification enzyme n=1 Tax=Turicibacter sanguinis TaxID=154288 RepID=UPI0032EED16D